MSSFRMAGASVCMPSGLTLPVARPARCSADGLGQTQKRSCDLLGVEATSHRAGGPDGKFHVGNCLGTASFVLYKVLGGEDFESPLLKAKDRLTNAIKHRREVSLYP